MATFRSDDYVSLQIVFMAIFSAIVLLIIAYFFLKAFKKRILGNKISSNKQLINVLESKYIPNLGYLFLISIDDKNFLAINSKLGIKLLQIKEDHKSNFDMDNKEVDL